MLKGSKLKLGPWTCCRKSTKDQFKLIFHNNCRRTQRNFLININHLGRMRIFQQASFLVCFPKHCGIGKCLQTVSFRFESILLRALNWDMEVVWLGGLGHQGWSGRVAHGKITGYLFVRLTFRQFKMSLKDGTLKFSTSKIRRSISQSERGFSQASYHDIWISTFWME